MEKTFETYFLATYGRKESAAEFTKKWNEQRNGIRYLSSQPLLSLVVIGEHGREETIASIRAQSYPTYEIVDSFAKARGEWVGIVDAGDILNPAALYFYALEISRDNAVDVLYSNEIGYDGRFLSKSRYSELTLAHVNYVGKLWLARRALVPTEWHSEHEILLALARKTKRFKLIPAFLYHRKNVASSLEIDEIAAADFRSQKFAPIPARPKVSAVVCFKDKSDWTIQAVRDLIEHAGETDLEIILVNNGSRPAEVQKVREAAYEIKPKLVDYPHPFNFGAMHDWAVKEHCRGELLFLMNNDVFLKQGALESLARWARLDGVGTVGMLLRYGHGTVQHTGIRAYFGGPSRLVRLGHDNVEDELSTLNHEVFANTFAACMMKRETYLSLGGLRPTDLPNGFGDVAFNFECLRKGLRNFYVGEVEGTHLESATRGPSYEYWEECRVEHDYGDILARMLREDLGFNRVAGADLSVQQFAKDYLTVKAREKTLWLKPVKQQVKKILNNARESRDNLKALYERTRPKTEK